MRVILATGLFAIGVELPRNYMAQHVRGLLILVVPTMSIGWGVVAGRLCIILIYGLAQTIRTIPVGIMKTIFPNLDFISCLAIAACLTPTDPIICATIVGSSDV
jgi:NhaP-type Na+/H+ or K+/H+ antiporter